MIYVNNSIKDWFRTRNTDLFETPLLSPDLYSIENLWGIILREVYESCRQDFVAADLKQAITLLWSRIFSETTVVFIRNSIFDVITAQEGHINY